MVHYSNCPVCRGGDLVQLFKCTDHLVSKEQFLIIKCKRCGFGITQEHPKETEAGRFYESDDYLSHTDRADSILEKSYRLVRTRMLRRKRRMIERSSGARGGKILDIGCGTGHFLNEMKKKGWEARGLEPNARARSYGISSFGIEITDPADIIKLPDRSFDCITMWHVLEHVYDPFAIFSHMKRILKPGGRAVIALPNTRSWDASWYGKDWAAWDVPRHIWHFSPESFTLFAGMNGFRITGIVPLPYDVFYISIVSRKNSSSAVPFLTGLITGLLFSVLSAFSLKRSSSLAYIIERNTA